MSDVALELLTKDANAFPLCHKIGAGGPSPEALLVYEVLLSHGQWQEIKRYLDEHGLPYKFAKPSNGRRVACNNPLW